MVSSDATDVILATLRRYFSDAIASALLTVTRRREGLDTTLLTGATLGRTVAALESALPSYMADVQRRIECAAELRALVGAQAGSATTSLFSSASTSSDPTPTSTRVVPKPAPMPTSTATSMTTSMRARSTVISVLPVRNPDDVMQVADAGRALCKRLGFAPLDQTKVNTAIAELVRNILQYGGGGELRLSTLTPRNGIEVMAIDQGPGIQDVDLVMSTRYRSRTGMGMGLKGTKRIVDEFELDSAPGRGTRVVFRKYV